MTGFWLFMLLTDLLIPCTMIGFGGRFLYKAPKNINDTFGYRTPLSMKNPDTWQFAHKYCGRLWFWGGLVLLPLSVLPLLCVLKKGMDGVSAVGTAVCFAQILPLAGSVIATEAALKKAFDKNGNRKAPQTRP